ncbi:MAG: hypothetical protein AB1715_10630, partial [Acidobacteriota bacterium]
PQREFAMKPFLIIFLIASSAGISRASDGYVPDPLVQAPVVHAGRFHILTSGQTSVVLDGSRGMSISAIGQRKQPQAGAASFGRRILKASLEAELSHRSRPIRLDQANDPSARLQIISQGPTHVAARAFFLMSTAGGEPYGTGTLDFYVYPDRIHLVPSVFIDYLGSSTRVTRAGLVLSLPEGESRVEIPGRNDAPPKKTYFERFGDGQSSFHLTVEQASGEALKIGWLRNLYPDFVYLREVAKSPERDELYEKWPLWIAQRGSPLGWKAAESSGVEVRLEKSRAAALSLLWLHQDKRAMPQAGYQVFNAPVAIFLGRTKAEAEELWQNFSNPLNPAVERGDFRYYNEIEGLYEVDSQSGEAALTFDCASEKFDRQFVVRFWNLAGNGACVIRADGKDIPFSLMNDGDLVEDPMVFISKKASGPARLATVSLTIPKGEKRRLTLSRRPGLQLTYEMYSELETYEAWSDKCVDNPIFRFHLRELAIYQATLPEGRDYAFFKLPLYWLKNGVNPLTFMNHLRGFEIQANGPEEVLFSVRSVNLQAAGLSSYTCLVPYEPAKLAFEIMAEFSPLDDGERWTSLEYCDLYPFEDVYRRNFHYRDVSFLTQQGVFERVGAGAWDMTFKPVDEPARLSYHSAYVKRSGPGAKVPDPQDGTVWILGNNRERGNVLFRRGEWQVSAGTKPFFTLCNAWMDVHNAIARGAEKSASEKISFAVDVFPGLVPSLASLNAMLARDVGKGKSARIKSVRYSPRGEIIGFNTDK